MSLTFPRPMPSIGAAEQIFDLARVDYAAPEAGGRLGGITAGFPRWRMDLTLGEMAARESAAWQAFVTSLRGSQRTFYARDLARPYPAAYPAGFTGLARAGGGAFPADGAASSWSLNGARDVLTLGGLPAGFALREGDLVGFAWSTDRRTAARILQTVQADSSGAASVAIEPAPPTFVPGGASVYLAQVEVVMRLVPAETEIGASNGVVTRGGRIAALQDLRP